MTAALRIYRTHRPSLVSAPVAPMDEADRAFFELRRQRVPTTSEYLQMKGIAK
jgi:hypothetical protein